MGQKYRGRGWFWADIENRYFVTFGGQPPELGVRRAGPEAPGDPDGDPAAPESRAPECSLGMSSAKDDDGQR
eukprot:s2349_g2.t5